MTWSCLQSMAPKLQCSALRGLSEPKGSEYSGVSTIQKETPMHFRILTCVLLIITCAGLAYPSQLAAQDNRDRTPLGGVATQPINSTLLRSNRGTSSAAACTVQGRPCNPLHPTCCGSLKWFFEEDRPGSVTSVGREHDRHLPRYHHSGRS